jgi:FdhD protein
MEINNSELISIKEVPIRKVTGFTSLSLSDTLSIEEPLEIRIQYGSASQRVSKSISVTMRTPGHDQELAIGFLFTEGIISSYDVIKKVSHLETVCNLKKKNIIQVEFIEDFIPHLMLADRNFYTTSSCGVCGKGSIEAIKTVSPFKSLTKQNLNISSDILYQLPHKLKRAQSNFTATGGIHAAGLFSVEGDLKLLYEDVGRHNALDKLIGKALNTHLLPLNHSILLLSGRASFELIQKAAMAGISVVVAIGAPSTLALELAIELNITLLGFLKEDRFNIYHSSDEVSIQTTNQN